MAEAPDRELAGEVALLREALLQFAQESAHRREPTPVQRLWTTTASICLAGVLGYIALTGQNTSLKVSEGFARLDAKLEAVQAIAKENKRDIRDIEHRERGARLQGALGELGAR